MYAREPIPRVDLIEIQNRPIKSPGNKRDPYLSPSEFRDTEINA